MPNVTFIHSNGRQGDGGWWGNPPRLGEWFYLLGEKHRQKVVSITGGPERINVYLKPIIRNQM